RYTRTTCHSTLSLHDALPISIGLFLIGLLWLGFIAFAPPDPLASELKKIATEDAEKIKERIRQIGQRVEFHLSPGSDPYIDFFRSEEHTSEYSHRTISYDVFC